MSNEQNAAEQAERIAAEGSSVRERVRGLVEDALAGRGAGVIKDVPGEVMEGVIKGVKGLADDRRGTVLADAIGGIGDGLASAANATKLAVEEAESRGEAFAKDDLKQTADDLRSLQDMLGETLGGLAEKAQHELGESAGDLASHAERAGASFMPAIESALQAITDHPGKAGADAASAGTDAATRGIGALFDAAGGLMKGLTDPGDAKKK
ncbi:MAG: hypothetical protein RIB60_03345 [Phycisphaerales bacterium]